MLPHYFVMHATSVGLDRVRFNVSREGDTQASDAGLELE
jgi:hypothetical protein